MSSPRQRILDLAMAVSNLHRKIKDVSRRGAYLLLGIVDNIALGVGE